MKPLMDYAFHKLHAGSFLKLHSQAAHVYELSCVILALPCTSFITIKGSSVLTLETLRFHLGIA